MKITKKSVYIKVNFENTFNLKLIFRKLEERQHFIDSENMFSLQESFCFSLSPLT
jgi:hypothetical protein